jgi:hypothetical protein
MQSVLMIVPAGGMLFEAAGIVDILMQANRLKSKDSHKQLYQVTIAATQPHRVVQGFSGMSLLADCRLSDLDPRQRRDTIIITGRDRPKRKGQGSRIGFDARLPGCVASFPFVEELFSWLKAACLMVAELLRIGGCWICCNRAFRR